MEALIYQKIMNDPNISEMQKTKEIEYKQYIDNHKNKVIETWEELKNNKIIYEYILSQSQSEEIVKIIDKNIPNHDNSKYGEEEWEPYRKRFYPINEEEKISSKKEFTKSWQHHKKNNTHHHEHWEEINQNENMPLSDVVEKEFICLCRKFPRRQRNNFGSLRRYINRQRGRLQPQIL